MKNHLPFTIYHLAFALLFYGCAQVVPPTGGPKDTKPPKVLACSPDNKSIGFNANKIEITFNKYIQLKDLQKQFIVSPPLKRLPVPLVKGKVLEISLKKDTLLENTTYTFNFGNAICDLNEGNQLKNFQYVFSTGTYIDSLSLCGRALDAFSNEPIKNGLVMLYRDSAISNDSTPYKSLPSYCGQTDDNGNFKLDNIKEGEYKLIAVSPMQSNYFYHPYSQEIAFKSGAYYLDKKDTANLYFFTEEKLVLHLIKTKGAGIGEVMLVFTKPVDSLNITPLNLAHKDTVTSIIQYSPTFDTAYYWTNYPHLDSLRFIVSRNTINIDTAIVYSIPVAIQKQDSKKKLVIPHLTLTTNISTKEPFNYHLPFTVKFGNPVLKYDLSKIQLTRAKDTIALKPDASKMPFYLSLIPYSLSLISDSSYRFIILPGAFTDIFGYANDTLKLPFKVQEENWFGSLKLNLSFSKKAKYLVQLLDNNNNVCRQNTIDSNATISYDALLPAMYRIRVITDDNNNGKWDTGNYLLGIQPEKVYYFSDKINVRSNWDLTQDWKVD